jgi:hypothetical protein
MKNLNDPIANRTRDLPACRAVPQYQYCSEQQSRSEMHQRQKSQNWATAEQHTRGIWQLSICVSPFVNTAYIIQHTSYSIHHQPIHKELDDGET